MRPAWRVCPDCGWSYEANGDTHQRFKCRRAFRGPLKHIPDPRFAAKKARRKKHGKIRAVKKQGKRK